MSIEKFQTNLPLVNGQGMATPITQVALAKLVAEVIALRRKVTELESRIEVLEP